MTSSQYAAAEALIDEAHAQDPNLVTVDGKSVPYELHYAQRSTYYLAQRTPAASPELRTAVRAQHFRRWEIPRSSYPATKSGYLQWRTHLKRRQASQVEALCQQTSIPTASASHIAALIRKDGLERNDNNNNNNNDTDTQILEDVACLVFLDLQFEDFEHHHDDSKIVHILRKTWAKMSMRGRELALAMRLSARAQALVAQALAA